MKKIVLILLVFSCCISCKEKIFSDIFIVHSKELNSPKATDIYTTDRDRYKYIVVNYFIKDNNYEFNGTYIFISNENYEPGDTIIFNKLQKNI